MLPKSRYEEDVHDNNHTSAWGGHGGKRINGDINVASAVAIAQVLLELKLLMQLKW